MSSTLTPASAPSLPGWPRRDTSCPTRRRWILPEVIRLAARDYDPSGVNRYLVTLAGEFHRFYNACRIKGEEAAVLAARLKLADTVRAVIANCLSLIGVAAPEKM